MPDKGHKHLKLEFPVKEAYWEILFPSTMAQHLKRAEPLTDLGGGVINQNVVSIYLGSNGKIYRRWVFRDGTEEWQGYVRYP